MITIDPNELNAVLLARLYKFLLSIGRIADADMVYNVAVVNCGAREFCEEVAKA